MTTYEKVVREGCRTRCDWSATLRFDNLRVSVVSNSKNSAYSEACDRVMTLLKTEFDVNETVGDLVAHIVASEVHDTFSDNEDKLVNDEEKLKVEKDVVEEKFVKDSCDETVEVFDVDSSDDEVEGIVRDLNYVYFEDIHVTISKLSYQRLCPPQYFDDHLMSLELEQEKAQNKNHSIYFFDSFFMDDVRGKKSYKYMSRRTKNVDLFDKEFLILPVNILNEHWYLIIVSNICGSNPSINVFDSMWRFRNSEQRLFDNLRMFLSEEWRNRKGTEKNFDEKNLPLVIEKSPQQRNGYDCGVYVILCLRKWMDNPGWFADPFWFQPRDALQKRIEMARKIEDKFKMQNPRGLGPEGKIIFN